MTRPTPEQQEAATLAIVEAIVDAFADAAEAQRAIVLDDGVTLARWAELPDEERRLIASVLHRLLAPLAAMLETADRRPRS